MPPERVTFLLWLGLNDSDGGFAAVAQLWRDELGEPYIRFHGAKDNWKILFPCEWREWGLMWAEIPVPEAAQRKREKEAEVMRRIAERKERKRGCARTGTGDGTTRRS